mmetsp:Transcript_27744/g.48299  ORF Transcript_27744/g.48299 Transcript_27744/m.48299 type:complete len:256 (-) Transcript_27744:94-861(-)
MSPGLVPRSLVQFGVIFGRLARRHRPCRTHRRHLRRRRLLPLLVHLFGLRDELFIRFVLFASRLEDHRVDAVLLEDLGGLLLNHFLQRLFHLRRHLLAAHLHVSHNLLDLHIRLGDRLHVLLEDGAHLLHRQVGRQLRVDLPPEHCVQLPKSVHALLHFLVPLRHVVVGGGLEILFVAFELLEHLLLGLLQLLLELHQNDHLQLLRVRNLLLQHLDVLHNRTHLLLKLVLDLFEDRDHLLLCHVAAINFLFLRHH